MAQNWAYVQGNDWANGDPSGTTKAYTSNVVSGNALIVIVQHSYAGCPPSVSDTQSNTYTKVVDRLGSGGRFLSVFLAIAGSSAANTVTPTFACGTMYRSYITEYTNIASGSYDVSAGLTNSTANNVTGGSVTTTANDDLVLSIFVQNTTTTISPVSGTQRIGGSNLSSLLQDENNATAGAVNPSASSSAVSAPYPVTGWTVAFKQTGATSAVFTKNIFIRQAVNRASSY
jgi:hypothetical protein